MISAENKTDAGVNSANLSFINSQEYNQVVSNILLWINIPVNVLGTKHTAYASTIAMDIFNPCRPFFPRFFP